MLFFLLILYFFSLNTVSVPVEIEMIEICDNGIDDDNDGLIDLNDLDCICDTVSTTSLIPNPSFEETLCCPSDGGQLSCAANWIQASPPIANFISIAIGAANIFFIQAYQMKKLYRIDVFHEDEIARHADVVNELFFKGIQK